MVKILPSILSADFACLSKDIQMVERGGADILHVDVMDGHFVPNLTIGPPVVKSLKKHTALPLDVHLMISNPDTCIKQYIESGADSLSFHVEASTHLHRTISTIKDHGIQAGLAVNPGTSLKVLDDDMLAELDFILLLLVNPGFGGQSLILSSLNKIQRLRQRLNTLGLEQFEIEVDGGINVDNIKDVNEAGASMFVAGSAIFNAPDPVDMIRQMRARCA